MIMSQNKVTPTVSTPFVAVAKELCNSVRNVNLAKENSRLRVLRDVRKMQASLTDEDCRILYELPRYAVLNATDLEILKVKFQINYKLKTATSKIDRVLYYYFKNNIVDKIVVSNHPVLQDNVPYVMNKIKLFKMKTAKYQPKDKHGLESVLPPMMRRREVDMGWRKYVNRSFSDPQLVYRTCNIYTRLRLDDDDVSGEDDVEDESPMDKYHNLLWENELHIKALRRRERRENVCYCDYDVKMPWVDDTPPVPIDLLGRLRERLLAFRMARLSMIVSPFRKYWRMVCPALRSSYDAWVRYNVSTGHLEYEMQEFETGVPALPEMEQADAHGEGVVEQNQASNVVLTETREESKEQTAEFQVQTWKALCSSEFSQDYNPSVDRWILIDNFTWSTSSTQNLLLASYRLPFDMVKKESITPCRMPNTLPFTVNRYWRGDLEVKIHVNANKFQIGSLQVSWYYSPQFDAEIALRQNVWTMSQTHHVIINAATSNEATLLIPYKYHLPYLHTKPRGDMPEPPLNLGTLYIRCLNPLTTSADGPTNAYVSVFVRAFNNEFTGMLAGDIDKIESVALPEMDRVLNTGMGVLNTLFPDFNRDNPPNIVPPSYLVPTASHSWSVGTGLAEPIHPLRLDGRGQCPHPPGIEIANEMDIKRVVNTFGLLTTLEWSKNDTRKSILLECDAVPCPKSRCKYFSPTSDTSVGYYVVPPVGVISNMFYGWRGTLEFRFDIVASQYHTGRLLVAYVPGVTSTSKVSFDQLRASTNMVFSLQESEQFTFSVPFICNKPYWPREYAGDYDRQNSPPPSRLYVAVLNQLIPMQSVSDKVFINMYIRAGPDFEVAIPVQPSIGLAYNRNFLINNNTKTQIVANVGYYPYYSGSFEDFEFAQVFRWGQAAHQIAQFDDYNTGDSVVCRYCFLEDEKAANIQYFNGVSMQYVKYAVFIFPSQLGYYCGIPCSSIEAAKGLAYVLQVQNKPLNSPEAKVYCISNEYATTSNTYCTGNPKWIVKSWTFPKGEFSDDGPANPEGERGSASNVVSVGSVSATRNGLNLYGESFFSLKDLVRRYQLYGTYNITTFKTATQDYVKIRFPVLPQGLALTLGTKTNINEVWNRCREGHIPLVASGYRFYRGSIRFRIVCDPKIDVAYAIQHRPDRRLRYLNVQSQDTVINGDSVVNHTYSTYIQLTNINGIIEFEVPYYQLGMYGLLQYPDVDEKSDASNYYSLGEIALSLTLNTSEIASIKNTMASIYYCMADDMTFSTFQGFPPMIFVNEIPDGTAPTSLADYAYPEMGLVDYVAGGVKNILSDTMEKAVKDSVREQFELLSPFKKEVLESMEGNLTSSVLKIVLECCHLCNSNSIYTISLVIINVLIELKFIIVDNIFGIGRVLVKAITTWLGRTSGEVISDVAEIPQVLPEALIENFDHKDWGLFVGMLFTGVTTAMAISCPVPKDTSFFSHFLSKQIPQAARSFSFVAYFINAVIDVSKRMIRWIMHKVYPSEAWYIDMQSDADELKDWVDEVLYLTSLDIDVMLDNDGYLYDRVYACVLYGREMANKYCETSDSKINIFLRVYDKILNMYNEMQARGKHPFVRKEPFCIWMYGKPGIGKSFLTEHISTHLLKSINYKLIGPKVFTVMPAGEFWTGCKNQPVLCMDDAFAVENGTTLERQLNTMYMVKSPVALNPPMADLKDKHLRYNPEIFYINSNKAFLNVAGLDPSAIHRRRDALIEARIKGTKKTVKDYTREQLRNFEHLEFRTHIDPSTADTSDTMWSAWRTYEELVTELVISYKKFYEDEVANYQDRLETYEDIEGARTGRGLRDDLSHASTVEELSQSRHQKAIAQYRQDLDNCLYSKMRNGFGYVSDIFNDVSTKIKSAKYFGPLLCKKELSDVKPEMDTESVVSEDEESKIMTVEVQMLGDPETIMNARKENYAETRAVEGQTWRENITPPSTEYKSVSEILVGPRGGHCDDLVLDEDLEAIRTEKEEQIRCRRRDQLVCNQNVKLCGYLVSLLKKKFTLSKKDMTFVVDCFKAVGGDNLRTHEYNKLEYNLVQMYDNLYIRKEFSSKYVFYKKPWKIYYLIRNMIGDYSGSLIENGARLGHDTGRFRNCFHYMHDPASLEYEKLSEDGAQYVWKFNGVQVRPCSDECCMDVPFLKHLWYGCWLNTHLQALWKHSKGLTVGLPDYYVDKSAGRRLRAEVDEYFKSFGGRITMWWKDSGRATVWKVVKWVMGAGLAIVSLLGIIYGIKYLGSFFGFRFTDDVACMAATNIMPKNVSVAVSPIVVSEGAYNIPQKGIKRPNVSIAKASSPKSQPEMAEQQFYNVVTAINNNVVQLIAETSHPNGKLTFVTVRCLALEANRILSIKHYHEEMLALPADRTRFYIRFVKRGVLVPRVEIDYLNLRVDGINVEHQEDDKFFYNSNFYAFYLPPQIPLFSKIHNLIAPLSAHSFAGRIAHLHAFGEATYGDMILSTKKDLEISSYNNSLGLVVKEAYMYPKQHPGLCGSVLLSDNLSQTPIIGIHVAGVDGRGYSEPLYREMLDCFTPMEIQGSEEMVFDERALPQIELRTTVFVEGCVSKEQAHVDTGKTNIVSSMVSGAFPITMEPNPLSSRDSRLPKGSIPIRDGCEKHGMPVRPFNLEHLMIATADLGNVINSVVIPIRQEVGVLSDELAVCGSPHLDHYESLEWNSSPGFGFKKAGESGKRFLFDLEETQNGYNLRGMNEKLRNVIDQRMEMRRNGIIPNTVFVDCLKDTTLPLSKCREPGKTRVFSVSPIDFTIAFKKYCGDFMAAYTRARFQAEHAIGINCDSEEWSGLYQHIRSVGDTFWSGDYSNFGPGLSLEVANAAFEIVIDWYRVHGADEEHLRILRVMKCEILCARHLCLNVVYKVCCGIPSGSPITAPLNSLVNSLYIRCMWLHVFHNDARYFTMEAFHRHVSLVTYGDDVVGCLSTEIRDLFNIKVLSDSFEKFGIRFTDARKTGTIVPYLKIEEVWFLSRCFVPHPKRRGIWLAGLKKESIENCANWIRKKNNCKKAASLINSRMAVELAFGWGPEYYNHIYRTLSKAWSNHREGFVMKQWSERDREIFEMGVVDISFYPQLLF